MTAEASGAGGRPSWRNTIHEIIFEADTPAGRWFDMLLIGGIFCSVAAVMLESMVSLQGRTGALLRGLEWFFTALFTVEYLLRLLCVQRPWRYARSFYGAVDFLAVVPTYLSVFFPGTRYFLVIRILRLLRVFRVLKLARYLHESAVLVRALRASRVKILVFLYAVLTLVVLIGSLMYVIEGAENGFTSIPKSVYWAIVTMTTVGYGDISPATPLGQMLASLVMILGYGIIAVPTGIMTVEFAHATRAEQISTQACKACGRDGHDKDASHCKFCGGEL